MKLAVVGASGRTGRHVVRQALAAGHQVTAVVRDPARLDVPQHQLLDLVTANPLRAEELTPALVGRDAAVCALGPAGRTDSIPVVSAGTRALTAAMTGVGTRRLVLVSASGATVDEGDGLIARAVAKPILRRVLRETFADLLVAEDVVRGSGLDWTIMRPPRLTDGGRRRYRTALDRSVRGGYRISRSDLADAILTVLADRTTIGRVVGLGY